MSKIVNFAGIDLFPDVYWSKKTREGFAFKIKSIILENIEAQQEQLLAISQTLMLGDYMAVDTTFGHYGGPKDEDEDPSRWLNIPLIANLQVKRIIPIAGEDHIRLIVREHAFRYKEPSNVHRQEFSPKGSVQERPAWKQPPYRDVHYAALP